MKEERHICPVCGYDGLEFQPYDDRGQTPSFEKCNCCGFEYGFHDKDIRWSFDSYRMKWIEEGAKWLHPESMPDGWSFKDQLKNIVPDLPKRYLNCAVFPFREKGVIEIAWEWKDAIDLIQHFRSISCAILGGDVFKKKDDVYEFTYDNWYCNRDSGSWDEYIETSAERAIKYVHDYVAKNGESFFFGVVASSKERWEQINGQDS